MGLLLPCLKSGLHGSCLGTVQPSFTLPWVAVSCSAFSLQASPGQSILFSSPGSHLFHCMQVSPTLPFAKGYAYLKNALSPSFFHSPFPAAFSKVQGKLKVLSPTPPAEWLLPVLITGWIYAFLLKTKWQVIKIRKVDSLYMTLLYIFALSKKLSYEGKICLFHSNWHFSGYELQTPSHNTVVEDFSLF